jgi:hypothetical protein
MTNAGPLYECQVDIGPHVLMPKLERLEVWGNRLVFQRETPLQIPFSAVEKAELSSWWGSAVINLYYKDFIGNMQRLRFADSNRLTPNNQATRDLHTVLQRLLAEWQASRQPGALVAETPPDRARLEAVVQETGESQVRKEVQGYGVAFVLFGVVSLLASSLLGLSAAWSAFILVIGLIAWRSKELPWLIVIGLAFWWAALSNIILGSGGGWQIVLGGAALLRYVSLRRRLQKPVADLSPVSARWMARLSLVGGILAVLLVVASVLAYALSEEPMLGDLLSEFIAPFSVLGFSAGLSSLLAFTSRRVVALIGMLLGLAVILVVVYLYFV